MRLILPYRINARQGYLSLTLMWILFLSVPSCHHREDLRVTGHEGLCRSTRSRNVASRVVCNSARVLSSISTLDGESNCLCFPVCPEFCSTWNRGDGWITAPKSSSWNSQSSMLTWTCCVRWPSFWNPTVWVRGLLSLLCKLATSGPGLLYWSFTILSSEFN